MAFAERAETLDKGYFEKKIGEIVDDLIMEQLTVVLKLQIDAYKEYT